LSAEDCVDASLAGLDAGKLMSIPRLHDEEQWTCREAGRSEISPKFRIAKPPPRCGVESRTTGVA
jgi:hypothetical protein